jgi:hypothetical protein
MMPLDEIAFRAPARVSNSMNAYLKETIVSTHREIILKDEMHLAASRGSPLMRQQTTGPHCFM